jgi:hypothetical protein
MNNQDSDLDTVVALDYNAYTPMIAYTRWIGIQDWLDTKGFKYTAMQLHYETCPHTLIMNGQDAIVFKLTFGL